MRFLVPLLFYLFFGALYYFWVGTLEVKMGRKTRRQALVVSLLFWPFAAQMVLSRWQFGDRGPFGFGDQPDSRPHRMSYDELIRDDPDKSPPQHAPLPPHPDYNEAAFPPDETPADETPSGEAPADETPDGDARESPDVEDQQELAEALRARGAGGAQTPETPGAADFDYAAENDTAFAALSAFDGEEAPLTEELTVTWRPTGVSKTYPAGTPFPSTLRKDWENGVFTRKS